MSRRRNRLRVADGGHGLVPGVGEQPRQPFAEQYRSIECTAVGVRISIIIDHRLTLPDADVTKAGRSKPSSSSVGGRWSVAGGR
ncbi:hypothetical protein [Microbispora bryophytorum]|uniref:hypothetical protein n=1 Tax=Microbispora bryophytorum TaxID=1460882 RepID=UPI00115AB9D0|nr:hypothetical protein [Microbispora bryophytorum]MBD3137343.1 hypothetical protein [Microbispora bryophytorum]TQS06792.1 hypothetical protein FLX07_13075 [Microbispora bryophytorum]